MAGVDGSDEGIERPEDLLHTYAAVLDRWHTFTTGEVQVRRRRGQVTYRQFALVYGLTAHTYETGHLLHGVLDRGSLPLLGSR